MSDEIIFRDDVSVELVTSSASDADVFGRLGFLPLVINHLRMWEQMPLNLKGLLIT